MIKSFFPGNKDVIGIIGIDVFKTIAHDPAIQLREMNGPGFAARQVHHTQTFVFHKPDIALIIFFHIAKRRITKKLSQKERRLKIICFGIVFKQSFVGGKDDPAFQFKNMIPVLGQDAIAVLINGIGRIYAAV